MKQKLVLLNGSFATGKTTLAKMLAEYYKKSVHIDVDQMKWNIRNGYIDEEDVIKGIYQLRDCINQHIVAIQACYQAASIFFANGYNLLISDPAYNEKLINAHLSEIDKFNNVEVYKILLIVDHNNMKDRCAKQKRSTSPKLFELFSSSFRSINEAQWDVVDTSNKDIVKVFDQIRTILDIAK